MIYALITEGVVVNLIWIHPMNASDFANAIPVGDLIVKIGDKYIDGKFYHDGVEVVSVYDLTSTYNAGYNSGYDHAVLDLIESGVL